MVKQTSGIDRKPTRYILPALAFFLAPGAGTAEAADAGYCKQYADTALQQFEQAKDADCKGLKYPVWSMDFDHHYRWCLTVPASLARAGTAQTSRVFKFCKMIGAPVGGAIAIPLGRDDDEPAHAIPDQIPQPQ